MLGLLAAGVLATTALSWEQYELFPLAGFFLWQVIGAQLLRFRPLVIHVVLVVACGIAAMTNQGPLAGYRIAAVAMFCLNGALVVFMAGRQRSGLPSPLSGALLADLRDRLNAQGAVPVLPLGWHSQSAMQAAHGVGYAGDFMVADLDEEQQVLDLVLVDVVGKGVKAAPSALLLAGALGGLIGTVRGEALIEAANAFLLRQDGDETFATAVHVTICLRTGKYRIISAGHPPALRWEPGADWVVDNARGLALGVLAHPEEHASVGVLQPGQALLFYTDGVVESRGVDIDDGIRWLQETARRAWLRGPDGAARRIIRDVPRGDDDRAVLILSREETTT